MEGSQELPNFVSTHLKPIKHRDISDNFDFTEGKQSQELYEADSSSFASVGSDFRPTNTVLVVNKANEVKFPARQRRLNARGDRRDRYMISDSGDTTEEDDSDADTPVQTSKDNLKLSSLHNIEEIERSTVELELQKSSPKSMSFMKRPKTTIIFNEQKSPVNREEKLRKPITSIRPRFNTRENAQNHFKYESDHNSSITEGSKNEEESSEITSKNCLDSDHENYSREARSQTAIADNLGVKNVRPSPPHNLNSKKISSPGDRIRVQIHQMRKTQKQLTSHQTLLQKQIVEEREKATQEAEIRTKKVERKLIQTQRRLEQIKNEKRTETKTNEEEKESNVAKEQDDDIYEFGDSDRMNTKADNKPVMSKINLISDITKNNSYPDIEEGNGRTKYSKEFIENKEKKSESRDVPSTSECSLNYPIQMNSNDFSEDEEKNIEEEKFGANIASLNECFDNKPGRRVPGGIQLDTICKSEENCAEANSEENTSESFVSLRTYNYEEEKDAAVTKEDDKKDFQDETNEMKPILRQSSPSSWNGHSQATSQIAVEEKEELYSETATKIMPIENFEKKQPPENTRDLDIEEKHSMESMERDFVRNEIQRSSMDFTVQNETSPAARPDTPNSWDEDLIVQNETSTAARPDTPNSWDEEYDENGRSVGELKENHDEWATDGANHLNLEEKCGISSNDFTSQRKQPEAISEDTYSGNSYEVENFRSGTKDKNEFESIKNRNESLEENQPIEDDYFEEEVLVLSTETDERTDLKPEKEVLDEHLITEHMSGDIQDERERWIKYAEKSGGEVEVEVLSIENDNEINTKTEEGIENESDQKGGKTSNQNEINPKTSSFNDIDDFNFVLVDDSNQAEEAIINSTKTQSRYLSWEICYTEEGDRYFYCAETNQSEWFDPRGPEAEAEKSIPTFSKNWKDLWKAQELQNTDEEVATKTLQCSDQLEEKSQGVHKEENSHTIFRKNCKNAWIQEDIYKCEKQGFISTQSGLLSSRAGDTDAYQEGSEYSHYFDTASVNTYEHSGNDPDCQVTYNIISKDGHAQATWDPPVDNQYYTQPEKEVDYYSYSDQYAYDHDASLYEIPSHQYAEQYTIPSSGSEFHYHQGTSQDVYNSCYQPQNAQWYPSYCQHSSPSCYQHYGCCQHAHNQNVPQFHSHYAHTNQSGAAMTPREAQLERELETARWELRYANQRAKTAMERAETTARTQAKIIAKAREEERKKKNKLKNFFRKPSENYVMVD